MFYESIEILVQFPGSLHGEFSTLLGGCLLQGPCGMFVGSRWQNTSWAGLAQSFFQCYDMTESAPNQPSSLLWWCELCGNLIAPIWCTGDQKVLLLNQHWLRDMNLRIQRRYLLRFDKRNFPDLLGRRHHSCCTCTVVSHCGRRRVMHTCCNIWRWRMPHLRLLGAVVILVSRRSSTVRVRVRRRPGVDDRRRMLSVESLIWRLKRHVLHSSLNLLLRSAVAVEIGTLHHCRLLLRVLRLR
mmetsp:Transcript_13191/g.37999  ORF Transcript_13191/g.37999 Transcript_13191/m.37999 type:complete len:241 (-) Transcript_13191:221-943(-)